MYAHVLVSRSKAIRGHDGHWWLSIRCIVFAKFSRPTARIAFSDKIVAHVRNGKPVLEFRLANQRLGSLSDATMKFTVMRRPEK